jgi:hypothetical protein
MFMHEEGNIYSIQSIGVFTLSNDVRSFVEGF